MKEELDCCGLECPAPVLRVRDALSRNALSEIVVRVDNDASHQNVSRFLEHHNFRVTMICQDGVFVITGSNVGVTEVDLPTNELPVEDSPGKSIRRIMVFVTSAHMGRGDDDLGDMLMFNFLKTLKEMGPELWRVTFVNSGVRFVAGDSEAIPLLQELAASGVQVTACGACLAYFHLLDQLRVGEVTNMLEIVSGMKRADNVVTV